MLAEALLPAADDALQSPLEQLLFMVEVLLESHLPLEQSLEDDELELSHLPLEQSLLELEEEPHPLLPQSLEEVTEVAAAVAVDV